MSKPEWKTQPREGAAAEAKTRKPYRKPAVRCEQVFETTALTCGKVQVTESQCHHNRKIS